MYFDLKGSVMVC